MPDSSTTDGRLMYVTPATGTEGSFVSPGVVEPLPDTSALVEEIETDLERIADWSIDTTTVGLDLHIKQRAAVRALTLNAGPYFKRRTESTSTGRAYSVIDIRGQLMKGSYFDDYRDIREEVEAARDDPAVEAIVLRIDSPGGTVAGMNGLAEAIAAVDKVKPVLAYGENQLTSAAYAISMGARSVMAEEEAMVGSIGVIAIHVDYSAQDKKAGRNVTEVTSGKYKNMLSPNKPLSAEGLAMMKEHVATAASAFFDLVAGSRPLSAKAVEEMEAAVFPAPEAKSKGLIDKVADFGEAVYAFLNDTSNVALAAGTDPADLAADESGSRPEETSMSDDNGTPAPDNVVDIETARAEGAQGARADAQARNTEIRELCALAGQSADVALEFISGALTIEEIRADLVSRRAAASEEGGEINGATSGAPDSEFTEPELDVDAIYERRRAAMTAPQTRREG